MSWNEIKTDNKKIYPSESITLFMMETNSGKTATHWVDKAYENYAFKKECMYNCFVEVHFTNEKNSTEEIIDIAEIEDLFKTKLRKVCVCHIIARITTDQGINIEYYVDDVEKAIATFNQIEDELDSSFSFSCEISDDEDWGNVAELFT